MHDQYGLVHGELQQLTPLQSVSFEGEIVDNGKLKQFSDMFLELFSICIWLLSILLVQVTPNLQQLELFAILGW